MTTARIQLPKKLIPVFMGEADYRCCYGGRGSGKTRSFATMTAVRGYQWSTSGESGVIVCAREHMNSLAESSFAEVKAAIEAEEWLAAHYDIGREYIRTHDGLIEYAFTGLRHNLSSIKSKAKIRLLWVDEAEPITDLAWDTVLPTVREEDSEVWVTWNPQRKEKSATHMRFRENPPPRSKFVELNWRDNPKFPAILNRRRLEDMEKRPDSYEHIWEGAFATVTVGAYFASCLTEAKQQNRIGVVAADPLMTIRAYWDIGGTGNKADACAIWIAQKIGTQVRVLDYYEAQGQDLATHANWLRANGYGSALCVLPHDGATHDKVFKVSYESALKEAGFAVRVIPNQGAGAANARIEALRRLFPSIHFNEATTEAGRVALGWYHEKRDDVRGIGLGPNHDWSSHGADAAGLMAIDMTKEPKERKSVERKQTQHRPSVGAWMGG